MSYNVLIFTERSKPSTGVLCSISDRIKEIYGYYTKTLHGGFYVVVSRKKDVSNVTTFCYGMRELWRIINN